MITKSYGKDFISETGCLSLVSNEANQFETDDGVGVKKHSDGWLIIGLIHHEAQHKISWINNFVAVHPNYGFVEGNFEKDVMAHSEAGFQNFYASHAPIKFDYKS